MKRIILQTVLLSFLLFPVSIVAQNFTLTVQNQTVAGSDFSFDIYIQVTSGDIHLADCDFRLDFNEANFSSPVISFTKDGNLSTYGSGASLVSSGTIISVSINNSIGYSSALVVSSSAPGSRLGTVTLTNSTFPSGTPGLTWRVSESSFNTIVSKFETDDNKTNISGNGTYTTPTDVWPVELTSFNAEAKGSNVELKWQTKTEVNNYGFEVERKVNHNESASWEKVGYVAGNGNSNSPKDYTYTDKNITGGPKFLYRLKQIDNDGKFKYSDEVEVEVIPDKYELFQNYPNPFNPVTNFRFQIVNPGLVTLKVYDILGNEVATVINKELEAGFYKYQWNANTLASGIYFYRLSAGNYNSVMKMILMK